MTEQDYLKGKRILIVDDEIDVLETLEELLQESCETVRAASFQEAKQKLEAESFDLAVLDIMGVDGFKLLEIAKQRKVTAVMLTAHALSPETTIQAFKKGAAYYIPKDKLADIQSYLNGVLEAKQKGKSFWSRWIGHMDEYYEKKFGPDWKRDDKDFWRKFPYYT